MILNLFISLIIVLYAPLSHALDYLEIPFDISVEKEKKGLFEDQRDVVQIGRFNLPADTTYSLAGYSSNGTQGGVATQEVRFLPNKEDVRTVEVVLTARDNPSAKWVLPLFWQGSQSSLSMHYIFKFQRHPSKSEREDSAMRDLGYLGEGLRTYISDNVREVRRIFKNRLGKYLEGSVLSKELVSSIIYLNFRHFKILPEGTADRIRACMGTAKESSAVQDIGLRFLKHIESMINEQREWYRPVAKLYGLDLEKALDTPQELAAEPDGTDYEFALEHYRLYYKNSDPMDDEEMRRPFKAIQRGSNRQVILDEINSRPYVTVVKLYEEYFGKVPDTVTMTEWLAKSNAYGFDDIEKQIKDLSSSSEGRAEIEALEPFSKILAEVENWNQHAKEREAPPEPPTSWAAETPYKPYQEKSLQEIDYGRKYLEVFGELKGGEINKDYLLTRPIDRAIGLFMYKYQNRYADAECKYRWKMKFRSAARFYRKNSLKPHCILKIV